MAAGKVNVSRRESSITNYSNNKRGFEVRNKIETYDFVRRMEIDDDGIVLPPPEKRRKYSSSYTGVWAVEEEEEEEEDEEMEPGEIDDDEDFSNAPNIRKSRWAESEESVVTQKDSSGGEFGYCSGEECYKRVVGSCDEMERVEDEREVNLDSDDDEGECGTSRGFGGRNMLQACRSVYEYEKLGKINEGSYGIVFKAKDKKSGEMVALKKLKMGNEREGFPLYYLREINTLLGLNHPSIVNVREVVVDDTADGFDNIYLVMDYVEHDLKSLTQARKEAFSQSEVKCLMLQLLEGIKHLHDNWVLHRDLKTSNLLMNNKGELKICDFGMARQYGSPLKPYTALVVTLWYRAPELLLGAKEYSTALDMWSVGCIMAELLLNKALFDGKTEAEQLTKIFKTLGTPNDKIWPGYSQLPGAKANFVHQPHNLLYKKFPRTLFTGSPILSDSGFDLLSKLLTYNPKERITAEEALNHRWFQELPPPKSKDFMPTFPVDKASNGCARSPLFQRSSQQKDVTGNISSQYVV